MCTHPPIHALGSQKPHLFPAARLLQFVNHKPRTPGGDTLRPGAPPTSGAGQGSGSHSAPLLLYSQSRAEAWIGGWGLCKHKRQEMQRVSGSVTMTTCTLAPPSV